MPLRSVEAATRDDAIAAAREQFGPQARIVGVRRVRSGGVLGFFATERYIAEVAPDGGRSAAPGPGGVGPADGLGSSPLASAAPATVAPPAVRSRSAAPARNGAAAYAAEAVRTVEPTRIDRPSPTSRPATEAAPRSLGWAADERPVDDRRVAELAGLLAGADGDPGSTASARLPPRPGGVQKATFARASWTAPPDDEADDIPPVDAPATSAPSPFTAALARMVADDAHVRQAVEDAVDDLGGRPAPDPALEQPLGESARSTPVPSADTAVEPPAARQEEETVGEQVIAPPSLPAARPVPMEVPSWAAEPEAAVAPDATRQEAIAEVLRSALARGHSDEALTGILRKVLDGASPQAALSEPAPAAAVPPELGSPEPAGLEPVLPEPVLPEPVLPAVDIWGTASPAPLWGEAPIDAAVTPIVGEFTIGQDTAAPEVAETEATGTEAAETEAAETEATGTEATGTEATRTEVAETEVASAGIEEVSAPLARTASDPAPFAMPMSMSLDVTSVMPPLSLLPPLPSSRGRGRPPVPPTTSRPPVPPSRPASDTAPDRPEPEEATPGTPPMSGPPTLSLATVTRLPVVPFEPDPEPVDPELVEPQQEPADEPVPDDVIARLAALGLPTRLLGDGFAADVERHGSYAALTRALGLRLPAAPELPTGAGEVLFVVGPGVETLRAARSLAASLRLDPDRVQWATRGDLAGLAPETSRMTTVGAAIARRQDAASAGTVTIVAVDAPMRTDVYWMAQMLAIWSPTAVWAVVEATRKPEDVEPWLDAMARVDALIVQDTDLSADPAAVLHRVAAPVAVLDGVRATPHRWASLLCERLEDAQA